MSIPQEGQGVVESYDELVNFIESGCKVPENWGIGTEHEKFGFDKKFPSTPIIWSHVNLLNAFWIEGYLWLGRDHGR